MSKVSTKKTTAKRASAPAKQTKSARVSKKSNPESKAGFDFLMALLVVSLSINVLVVCIWVVLRITDMYDQDLAQILLAR